MGVDVNLYAEGTVSDTDLAVANEYLMLRGYLGWKDEDPPLARSPYPAGRIEFFTLQRYYGPGYERGSWPEIYGMILALRAALPDATVYYGGDASENGLPATDEELSAIWEHWLGPHGMDYRRPRVDTSPATEEPHAPS